MLLATVSVRLGLHKLLVVITIITSAVGKGPSPTWQSIMPKDYNYNYDITARLYNENVYFRWFTLCALITNIVVIFDHHRIFCFPQAICMHPDGTFTALNPVDVCVIGTVIFFVANSTN